MIEFSENEIAVGKALLEGPLDAIELRKKTGIPADELIQALKRLMNLRIVELQGQKYKLVDRILEKAGRAGEFKEKYRVRMIIEGSSKDPLALEKQMNVLVDKIKQEKILVHDLELAEIKEDQGQYHSFIELDFGASSFDSVIRMITNYGPSSIELLEPKGPITLTPKEVHDSFVDMANFTHYYVGLVVNLSMQNNILREELRKAKNQLREKELQEGSGTDEEKESTPEARAEEKSL